MSRPKPPVLLLANFVSLALAVACSGSLSSPIGPTGSDTLNSASGDTTIRGRASTSGMRSTAAAGSSSSKVCVTGTNHCKHVDSNGQFEIKGNFSGDVPLTFITPQGTTSITVPGVIPGETLVVEVLLAGGSATVKIESRNGGNGNAAATDDDSSDDVSDDVSDDASDDESEDDDSEDDESEDDDSGQSGPGNRGRQ